MNHYEKLKTLLSEFVSANSKTARQRIREEAVAAIQALEAERPAPAEALSTAYEEGALQALEIVSTVRREHEESFRPARHSAAGIVLNGVENYGQALVSAAESRVSRHLNERRRKMMEP